MALPHFDAFADDSFTLVMCQSRRLSRGSNRDDSRDSSSELCLHQFLKRAKIDPIPAKGSDQCSESAAKHEGLSRYRSIVPSKTNSAGPVRVTPIKPSPAFLKST